MQTGRRGLSAAFGCALIALGTALAGCSGGEGELSADRATTISGVFLGSQTQTRAVGDRGVVDLDIVPTSNTALSGVGRLTLNEKIYTGRLTGTSTGNSAVIDVAYGTYGTAEYTVSLSGTTLRGTYTHTAGGATDSGSVTIVGQLGNVSPRIAGSSFGSTTDFGSPETQFTIAFNQSGDDLTMTGTYNGAPFTGTGLIIGTDITFTIVEPNGMTVTFTGVVASTLMSGTYVINAAAGSVVGHGEWTVNRPPVSP